MKLAYLAMLAAAVAGCNPDASTGVPEIDRQAARTAAATADVAGAFQTPSPQPVKVIADTRHKLELHADQSVFASTIDAAATVAAGIDNCVADPADTSAERKAALLAKLQDALQNRFFNAYFDRRSAGGPSDLHQVAHTWTDADGRLFSARLGTAPELLPGRYATAVETSRNVFQYGGGSFRIADRTGQVADQVTMACPNLDTITVTVIQ